MKVSNVNKLVGRSKKKTKKKSVSSAKEQLVKQWDKSVHDDNDGEGGNVIMEEDVEESFSDETMNLMEQHKQLQELAI